jgi:hypothetical protein
MQSQLDIVNSWDSFRERWHDPRRSLLPCRLDGELAPARYQPVDPLLLLDQARRHPQARILSARPGRQLIVDADASERIRSLPIDAVAADPHLHISLFDIALLTEPGGALHEYDRDIFAPFTAGWRERGFVYDRVMPVLFITGSASATNYHFDPMPTLPWHLFGSKRFHGLKDPRRWCPMSVIDEVASSGQWPMRPDGIIPDDCLVHDNAIGDLLWIPMHVPHWVDAGTFSATLTFTFPGLRMHGEPAHGQSAQYGRV